MRRDDDADPELAAHVADQLEHVPPADRVKSGRRLVEEGDGGIVDERLCELHALLHPRRVRPDRAVALFEQPDVAEDVRGAQAGRRPREPADLGHVGEKLGRGDRAREAVVLRRVPDARAVLGRASRIHA